MQQQSFAFEKMRKKFHLCALVFPLIYQFLFTTKLSMTLFLTFIATIVLALDISRHHNKKIGAIIDGFFSSLMRQEEKTGTAKLSGASFMMIGLLISAALFPKGLVLSSWLILIISDSLASLIGMRIGRKLQNGKSIEGSSAFFASAVFISILCCFFVGYDTSFVAILFACASTTLSEFFAKKIGVDDNLLIPIIYGLSTKIFTFLL